VSPAAKLRGPVSLTLHPHPRAAASARRFVASVTEGLVDDERARDLEVMVSEIVSNGVLHAETTMELVVASYDSTIRIELVDRGPGSPQVRPEPGPTGGYGLRIVEALARRWGVDNHPAGKIVWFEL
jgi:anti-sigma regulatory factor (Ser/Thr protein kinase)